MFTSKDFELNNEHRQRQMAEAAHNQQCHIAQSAHETSFQFQQRLINHLSISIILITIVLLLFFFFTSASQAQQNIDAFDPGSSSNSGTVGIDLMLTAMALQDGDIQEAMDIISNVIADAPDVAAAYTLRSAIYITLGDYELALLDGEAALTFDADESAAYFFMGQAAFGQERYDAALAHYTAYLRATDNATASDLVSYLHGDSVRSLIVELIANCDRHIVTING